MEIEARRRALKERMQATGITHALITDAANRYYLSGFELHDGQCNESSGCLLFAAEGEDWLLTDGRFTEAAQELWPAGNVHIYGGPRVEKIGIFLQDSGITDLWVEMSSMCAGMYQSLADVVTLHTLPGFVEDLRMRKSAREQDALRASCVLNHHVFAVLREELKAGLTEKEVAWILEKEFREQGAEGLSFAPIVAFGPRGALPHAVPGEARLTENTPVLIDMGGRLQEYCSDQTRSWWFGKNPTREFQTTLELVQEAQRLAIARIAPGVSTAELYHTARDFFAEEGVVEFFTHSLGHGIGLETHEGPGVGPLRSCELVPGMVITVEPGLYYPAWGGVRWEHMVLVTEDGHEVL